jgi:hypothetical protein
MADKQPIREVVADLTWAELYATKLRKEIKSLIPIVKKLPIRPELVQTAKQMRKELENTNGTVAGFKALAGFQ